VAAIDLGRDVVDGQLVARYGIKIGRVDGLTIELDPGAPPRVADILIGAPIIADRVGGWMVRLLRAVEAVGLTRGRVTRIPFRAVRMIGEVLEVDVDAETTTALRTERLVKERLIGRIPGARGSAK